MGPTAMLRECGEYCVISNCTLGSLRSTEMGTRRECEVFLKGVSGAHYGLG